MITFDTCKKILISVLLLALSSLSASAETIFAEDFETPSIAGDSNGYDGKQTPKGWVRGIRGAREWWKKEHGMRIVTETNQGYSVRHADMGITSNKAAIAQPLTRDTRYTVSFDVAKEQWEQFEVSEARYEVQLIAYPNEYTNDNRKFVYKMPADAVVLNSHQGVAGAALAAVSFEYSSSAMAGFDTNKTYELAIRLRALESLAGGEPIAQAHGAHGGVVFDNVRLDTQELEPSADDKEPSADDKDEEQTTVLAPNLKTLSSTTFTLDSSEQFAMEHKQFSGLLGRSTGKNVFAQNMSFSTSGKETDAPKFYVAASLTGEDVKGVQRNNQGGILIESVFDRATNKYRDFKTQEFRECKEMIGVQSSDKGDVVAALCRRNSGDHIDATADLVADYERAFGSKRLVQEGADEMWLYEWSGGDAADITTTPAKYRISRALPSTNGGSDRGNSFLIFNEQDNNFGVYMRFQQKGGHVSDIFMIVSRNKGVNPLNDFQYFIKKLDEDGSGSSDIAGGGISCGSHASPLALALSIPKKDAKRVYAMLCEDDTSVIPAETAAQITEQYGDSNLFERNGKMTVGARGADGKLGMLGSARFAFGSRKEKLGDRNREPFLFLQKIGKGGHHKGGVVALVPYQAGWLALVVGARENPMTGELDYVQDDENVEPRMELGLVPFDENGKTDGIRWIETPQSKGYISHPQLVDMGGGNFLLGYGVLPADHSLGKSFGELRRNLIVPEKYYFRTLNLDSGEVGETLEVPEATKLGQADIITYLNNGQFGWAAYSKRENTRSLEMVALTLTTIPASINTDELQCGPGEQVHTIRVSREADGPVRGYKIFCSLGTVDQIVSEKQQNWLWPELARGNPAPVTLRASCLNDMVGFGPTQDYLDVPDSNNLFTAFRDVCSNNRTPLFGLPGEGGICSADELVTGVRGNFKADSETGLFEYTNLQAICAKASSAKKITESNHDLSCSLGEHVTSIRLSDEESPKEGVFGITRGIQIECSKGIQSPKFARVLEENWEWQRVFSDSDSFTSFPLFWCRDDAHRTNPIFGFRVSNNYLANPERGNLSNYVEFVCPSSDGVLADPEPGICQANHIMTGVSATYENETRRYKNLVAICTSLDSFVKSMEDQVAEIVENESRFAHEKLVSNSCSDGEFIGAIANKAPETSHSDTKHWPSVIEFACDSDQFGFKRNHLGSDYVPTPGYPKNSGTSPNNYCSATNPPVGIRTSTSQPSDDSWEGLHGVYLLCEADLERWSGSDNVRICDSGQLLTGIAAFENDRAAWGSFLPKFARAYPLCSSKSETLAGSAGSGEPAKECFLSADENGAGTAGLCPDESPQLKKGIGTGFLISANGDFRMDINKGLNLWESSSGKTLIGGNLPITEPINPTSQYIDSTYAWLREDGNFVLHDSHGEQLWESGTADLGASHLILDNQGILSLECEDGSKLWVSHGDAPLIDKCNPYADDIAEIELGRKTTLVHETLCTTESDLRTLCPAGIRYQFLSINDSYIYVEGGRQTIRDGLGSLIPVVGSYKGIKFLLDIWKSTEAPELQCLSQSGEDSECFGTGANVLLDSIFNELPKGVTLDKNLTIGGNDYAIPNFSRDSDRYIVNTCSRHTSNAFYQDSLEELESLAKTDKDAFVQKYFPRFDCLFTKSQEDWFVDELSDYKDTGEEILAVSIHVAQFFENLAVQAVPLILTDGLAEAIFVGTELAETVAVLGEVGAGVGSFMGATSLVRDYAELSQCDSNACRAKALTDMTLDSIMVFQDLRSRYKEHLSAPTEEESSRLDGQAAAKSIPKFTDSFGNGVLNEQDSFTSMLEEHRVQTLGSLNENFLTLTLHDLYGETFVKNLKALPDYLLKDGDFMGELFVRVDGAVTDTGLIEDEKLIELNEYLEETTEKFGC